MSKRRFLVVELHPNGVERVGSHQIFQYYASVDNVIRFGLRKDVFTKDADYHIYSWPEGSDISRTYVTAYKGSKYAHRTEF